MGYLSNLDFYYFPNKGKNGTDYLNNYYDNSFFDFKLKDQYFTYPTFNPMFNFKPKNYCDNVNFSGANQTSDKTFNKALKFLYEAEGGYTNNKNDHGGATNLGITQSEYNEFLKKSKMPMKNVRNITKAEATKIFYDEYWITSGAYKEKDPKKAIALFDTAVLYGPGTAKRLYKQSDGDLDKFFAARKARNYQIVANNSSQKEFLKGWNNRNENLKAYVQDVA